MELEVELYDCVINGGLGRNHLLKKKKESICSMLRVMESIM